MARLSRPGWLWLNTKVVYPQTVTHPSSNRARRRATTLIKTNVLPPLSQAATIVKVIYQLMIHVSVTCCTGDVQCSVPLQSPVNFSFDPHDGSVHSIECSPYHRNLFLTCASDCTARIYSMLQASHLVGYGSSCMMMMMMMANSDKWYREINALLSSVVLSNFKCWHDRCINFHCSTSLLPYHNIKGIQMVHWVECCNTVS